MSLNAANTYDIAPYVAELYDQLEQTMVDVELIRRLLGGRSALKILEPFCGSARIAIPLAGDGHQVVGFDQSACMLERGRARLASLSPELSRRISLIEADVTSWSWPTGFDLVILGINSFYELATPEEQERCIAAAASALRQDGYLYVDNNHMEGELAMSWRTQKASGVFPTGRCADGTCLEGSIETTWFDATARLVQFLRSVRITYPDGRSELKQWRQQLHPVSMSEVRGWLEQHGFVIECLHGDHEGTPYTAASPRAIFWARRAGGS